MFSLKVLPARGEHEGRLGIDLRALSLEWFDSASREYSIIDKAQKTCSPGSLFRSFDDNGRACEDCRDDRAHEVVELRARIRID